MKYFLKQLLRWCALSGIGVVIAWLIVSVLASDMVLHPPGYVHRRPEQGLAPIDPKSFIGLGRMGKLHDPKTDLGLEYESVEFPASDGSTLRGWYIPGEAEPLAGVVAVHGASSDRREFLRHVPIFHDAGYPVLLFDCREHGISDGASRGISLGIREHEDVISAVRYLKQVRKIPKVAALGTSQGGASVILAAAQDPSIDAVISENPFTSPRDLLESLADRRGPLCPRWILEPGITITLARMGALGQPGAIDVIASIAPRPILILHGTADEMIPVEQSKLLFERAREPKFLWIVPGARHACLYNKAPEEYRKRMLEFLGRFLPSHTVAHS